MKEFIKRNVISSRDSKSVALYLKEISKYQLLSPEQEVELALKAQAGDNEARTRLISCNLRFVVTVAHAYQGYGLPLEDLISEGNIGLQKAAELYDPTKGFRFCSYAVWWIRQAIYQALTNNARMVRLPANKLAILNQINNVQKRLMQQLMRQPSLEEIAEEIGIDVEKLDALMRSANPCISYDATYTQDRDEEAPLLESLSTNEPGPDYGLMQESQKVEIAEMMQCLSAPERYVLEGYYGLNGTMAVSFSELALKLNMTNERVRQIHNKALERLRKCNAYPTLQVSA